MSKQIEELRQAVSKLNAGDQAFANSIIKQSDDRGSISDRQFRWVNILLRRAAGDESAKPLAPTVKRIFNLFSTAKSRGLKFPKIRLSVDNHAVVLNQAGEKSKYKGQVQITDGGRFGSNRYFGRIDEAGVLHDGQDMIPSVRAMLVSLSADPEKAAAAHGHLTGECCFCGLGLTDGRSIAVGYGPVCAEKFGLAWGAEKAATEVTAAMREAA